MDAKKPKGFGKFDRLMKKLAKVPPEALTKDATNMKYLITVTLEDGQTLNMWVETYNMGRITGRLLCGAEGVKKVELYDVRKNPFKMVNDWLGTA